jgi:disulfide oxidoreductase YuzD
MAKVARNGKGSTRKAGPNSPLTGSSITTGLTLQSALSDTKTSQVEISRSKKWVRKKVHLLKPSPENSLLYRAIVEEDEAIQRLAESIKKNHCVPLVVTQDNFIVSGHRRHKALRINGTKLVRCFVLDKLRDEYSLDEYVQLLREYNEQRDKSVAEQIREKVVDIKPQEAHRQLSKLRDKSVNPLAYPSHLQTLHIRSDKTRHAISEDMADHVKFINEVVFNLRKDYWPLSIRGVHYVLLNYDFIRGFHWAHKGQKGHGKPKELRYKNDAGSYKATSDLITRLRLNGSIPWKAFDDPTRPIKEFFPFSNVREFMEHEINDLFERYWRDLMQSQSLHVECFVEKNTIYSLALRVTNRYQITTSSGRGFNSIDPWHDLYERFLDGGKERLIVICLTDHDPEGQRIPIVGGETLAELGLDTDEFDIVPVAVTRNQVEQYDLPDMAFAKESSSNYDWYVERNNGDKRVWELEALDPQVLMDDLENAIKSIINVEAFNEEAAIEQRDAVRIQAARDVIVPMLLEQLERLEEDEED